MSEGNIPIDYNIRWQRNQVSKKTKYAKMSVVGHYIFVFVIHPFFNSVAKFERKLTLSHCFDYLFLKIVF